MNGKRVNWMFLTTIVVEIIIVLVLGLLYRHVKIGIASNIIISELILLVPALVFAGTSGTPIREMLVFKKIKISTVLMTVLFTYLSMPLVTLVNAFTMLFSDNVIADMSEEILNMPFLAMILLMGILGPVCEEVVFRGFVHHGFRKSGSAIQAMFFSALLFGLMHMNFNQALYAFVIGFMLVLLKEATKSIWTSIVYHIVFNSNTVIMMYLSKNMVDDMSDKATLGMEDLVIAISANLILATIMTAIGACALIWIAKNEQNEGFITRMWSQRKQDRGKIITIPLIISFVLCIAFMLVQLLV